MSRDGRAISGTIGTHTAQTEANHGAQKSGPSRATCGGARRWDSPLMGPGEWGPTATFTPLVVLVVLCAFTLTEEPRRSLQTRFIRVAVALVIGLIAGVALAWPAQVIFGGNADIGTWVGQAGGLVVAATVAWFLIRDMKRRKGKSASPADAPAEKATAPAPKPHSKWPLIHGSAIYSCGDGGDGG